MADWCVIHDCEQGTSAWRELRRGKITSSRASGLFAEKKRGGWLASREQMVAIIAMELLRGEKAPSRASPD